MQEKATFLVHQQWKPFFHWSAVLVSLALANLIQYLLNPKSSWWDFYTEAKWTEILATILVGVVIYAVLFGIVTLLSRYTNKYLIFRDNILVHFFATTLVVICAMFFLLYVESFIYDTLWPESSEFTPELELGLKQYLVVNMIIAAFVNSFYHSYFFFKNWKAKVIESKKLELHTHQLKENALQSELEILKLQLDPHFLFNNFSILTQLIETNPKGAQEFLSNLSKVYRYVLTTGKKDVIALEDELKFVEMYFHLIKIRHGATIFLNINFRDADRHKGILPVTLQLLIENAIKHNIATLKQPLYLTIESGQNASIVVKNNFQPINIDYKSTGMGLKNIKERYQLLQGKKPEIMTTQTSFEVRLPLLNL